MIVKKLLCLLLVFLPFWGHCEYHFSSVTSEGQTLYYRIIPDGSGVAVTYPGSDRNNPYQGFFSPASHLVVPSSIAYQGTNYAVVALDSLAFCGCQYLVSVVLPTSVQMVGHHAFAGCIRLQSVVLPSNLAVLDSNTFEGCVALEAIRLPSTVQDIRSRALAGCVALDTLTVGSEVPPIMVSSALYGVATDSLIVAVPCGTSLAYSNDSFWHSLGQHIEIDSSCWIQLLLYADSNRGVALGSGIYRRNSEVPIYAVPYNGYYHASWSDGNMQNPRMLLVTDSMQLTALFLPIHSDTLLLHDTVQLRDTSFYWVHDTVRVTEYDTLIRFYWVHDTTYIYDTLIANYPDTTFIYDTIHLYDTIFLYDTLYLTIHDTIISYDTVVEPLLRCALAVVSQEPSWGIGIGTGRYSYGEVIEIGALPMVGCHFVRWEDGSVENPRRVTLEGDSSMVAFFAPTEGEQQKHRVWGGKRMLVVEGAIGEQVTVYDMAGRKIYSSLATISPLRIAMPTRGIYVVQVGAEGGQRIGVGE